jgi:hypothetical protein
MSTDAHILITRGKRYMSAQIRTWQNKTSEEDAPKGEGTKRKLKSHFRLALVAGATEQRNAQNEGGSGNSSI